VYDPSPFVVTASSLEVFVSVSVTCAPATAPPFASVTVPVTPETACAEINTGHRKTSSDTANKERNFAGGRPARPWLGATRPNTVGALDAFFMIIPAPC
jgi:hypothetical protein